MKPTSGGVWDETIQIHELSYSHKWLDYEPYNHVLVEGVWGIILQIYEPSIARYNHVR